MSANLPASSGIQILAALTVSLLMGHKASFVGLKVITGKE